MSFKACLDIAINHSYFRIKQFHKIGYIRYQTSVYYREKLAPPHKKSFGFPYITFSPNLYKAQDQDDSTQKKSVPFQVTKLYHIETVEEAQLLNEKFVSRLVPVKHSNNSFEENVTCHFKVYIDIEKMQEVELFVEVDLVYFSIGGSNNNMKPNTKLTRGEVVSTFTGRVNKPYGTFTYLPVNFDPFESIYIASTYHGYISEFKFTSEEEEQSTKSENQSEQKSSILSLRRKLSLSSDSREQKIIFESFKEYLDHVTDKFTSNKIRTFYNYYKKFLTEGYSNMIEVHNKLIQRIDSENTSKLLARSQGNKKITPHTFDVSDRVLKKFEQMFNSKINTRQFEEQKQGLSELILQDFSEVAKEIYHVSTQFSQNVERNSLLITQIQKLQYVPIAEQRYKNNIFSHEIKLTCLYDYTYSRYDDSGKSHLKHASQQNKKKLSEADLWKDSFIIEDVEFLQNEQRNIKMFEEVYPVKINQRMACKDEEESTRKSEQSRSSQLIEARKDTAIESISKWFKRKSEEVIFCPSLRDPTKAQSARSLPEGSDMDTNHIIFLVHGFQAAKCDMLLLKFCLESNYPAHVIISTSNVGKTEESIHLSGERLAEEVRKVCKKLSDPFKLSFIGHSMGGLIIKSALTRLQGYRHNFHTYISICTPHLGYMYAPSSLIRLGLWFLGKVGKCQSLEEIEMKDHEDYRKTCLYKLTQNNLLGHFSNIAFLTSSQDEYVPYESARIEKSERILSEMRESGSGYRRSRIISEMVDSTLKDIRARELSRIDVVFNIEESSIDSFIGRTGHVKFLSDTQFIKEFMICFKKFFV